MGAVMSEEIQRGWNVRRVDVGALSGDVLGELIRRGALELQDELDLKCDGLAGPSTVEAIEEHLGLSGDNDPAPAVGVARHVEIPTPRGVEAVYGSFGYKSHPTQKGAILIDRGWVRQNIVKVDVPYIGKHTWMHRLIADEFRALFAKAVEATDHKYLPTKVWSWVARRKMWRNNRSPSMHAWGVAFDVDSHLNRYGTEEGPLYDHPEFVKVFEDAGYSWGGRFSTPDPHHFERVKR
jgi:hypothetical protein